METSTTRSPGRDAAWLLGALGAGAALMYALDPVAGRRRRALARDQAVSLTRTGQDRLAGVAKDVRNRAQGVVAEAQARLRPEGPVPERVLEARVRERIGRSASHPGPIDVDVRDGHVTLSGPVLAAEAAQLLADVSGVRGVASVEDRLERHETAGDVPALQGGATRGPAGTLDPRRTRLVAAAAGTALVGWAARRGGPLGWLAGLGGVAALAGLGTRTRGIRVQDAVTVDAPVQHVFEFWCRPENLPTFMRHVREVRPLGNGRYHWVVDGPAGAPVEWDARTTRVEANRVIAWRTEPGSLVAHSGIVRFTPVGEDGTRVAVDLRYDPPGGAAGHAVAVALGTDPQRRVGEDLERMRTSILQGMPPRDATHELLPEGTTT
jgi:uncharacterized membrane protein